MPVGNALAENVNERVTASWRLTNACNYDCDYCFGHSKNLGKNTLEVENLIQTLQNTMKKWLLVLVGGEVFMIPRFITLCKRLTDEDIHIGIQTNLSIDSKVREFAENINPSSVSTIYVSTHIVEREKHNDVVGFIERLQLLTSRGFEVSVNYVLHPSLLDRYPRDRKFFGSVGIDLKPMPFKGRHNGKQYPGAYTESERALILIDHPEASKFSSFASRGLLCDAGRRFVYIQEDGRVVRCYGDGTVLGSVSTSIGLFSEPEPCTSVTCPCWGGMFLLDRAFSEALLSW